jgi:hypothetical protein
VSPSRFLEFVSGSTRSTDKTKTKKKKFVGTDSHTNEMEGISSPQFVPQELNPRIVLGQRLDFTGLISPIRQQVLATKARNNPALILF